MVQWAEHSRSAWGETLPCGNGNFSPAASRLVVTNINTVTFVAPNLAWGEARGGSIPRQWGCDRRATKPQAKFGATLRAAVLFGPGSVARSLQIHLRDMLVARALPGPKTPRRKRHRIYVHDHLPMQGIEQGDGEVISAQAAFFVVAVQ